jgi:6-pyruvoyltetrahydropterin/6-carboxytetrahydropterin synthase
MIQLTREFKFDAAHFLTKYHGKCEHLHGHTYRLWVTIEGETQENGMLLDHGFLKKIVKEQIINKFDHRCLNDTFENPTAEIIVKYIWDELVNLPELLKTEANDPNMPDELKRLFKEEGYVKEINEKVRLVELKLAETDKTYVVYRG